LANQAPQDSLLGIAARDLERLSPVAGTLVPQALALDLRSVLCVLSLALSVGCWTVLLWWHVLGRGQPVRVRELVKLLRR